MNDDTIYNQNIICLFINNFNDIQKKYNINDFDFKNFEDIFNYFCDKLSSQHIKINEFIKYYYLFTFLYLNYTNYLVFINHPDTSNAKLEKIINKIKTSANIAKNILKFSYDENIYKIIKLNDIFISNRIRRKKVDKSNIQKYTDEYIFDLKQLEKISSLSNDNYKKILNIVIYRYVICKKNNYINYHELYLKKMVRKKNIMNNSNLDFDNYIIQIPKLKKILNINTNFYTNNSTNIEISIIKLVNYILSKQDDKFYCINDHLPNHMLIKNNKYQGHIKINISNKYSNIEFNQYQTNYSFLHYNIKELSEYNFLKKTFTNIEINIFDNILKDLSSILEFIHLITTSLKIFSFYPSDIYECLYPIDYSNYYFNTFYYFLDFFKNEINHNYNLNKFIIDVIKFLYIYSYYDYYFYYSNDFVEGLINNLQYKNDMFLEFTENLKKILKLPQELNNYPPFFSQEFDLNDIIYYNFEILSYFKLYDFMNAIYKVFELKNKKNTNNKINLLDLISENIFFDNKSNLININKSVSVGIDKLNIKKHVNDTKIISNTVSNSTLSSSSKNDDEISSSSTIETDTEQLTSSIYDKKSINNNYKSKRIKKELETNLDSEIINILDDNEKSRMENINAYVELNYTNMDENYILDTEC